MPTVTSTCGDQRAVRCGKRSTVWWKFMSSGHKRWENLERVSLWVLYLHLFGIHYVAAFTSSNTKYSMSVSCDTCGRECGRGACI